MQSTNFVAIMAILNAMVERFKEDAVRTNLAALGKPFGANLSGSEEVN